MKVNRTTAGRSGTYSGRGRSGIGGNPGNTRGEVPRGRARAGAARETGYPQENANARESSAQRDNGYQRDTRYERETVTQRRPATQRETGYQRESVYQRQSYQNAREPYSGGYERQGARSASARKLPVRAIAAGAVLLAAVALVFILVNALGGTDKATLYSNEITSGVKINDQDVSGQDVDKVSRSLRAELQAKIDEVAVTLTYGGQTWSLGGQDLGFTDNVDEVMSKVALLARVGTEEQRRAEADKYKQEGYQKDVLITPDPDKLKIKLNEIATKVNHNGKDASVNFNWLIDIADPENPTQDEINSMFTIIPETQGQVLDIDATAQAILVAVNQNPKCTVELAVKPFVPKYTAENLKQCRNLLSVFNTRISSVSTKERRANIKLALSKFNGLTIWPDQELSFNDTTGPRTASAGYQMAHVISGGTYVDDWGGGVCQVSTTIYNAAVLAGLTITDSGPHTIPSDYIDKAHVGFDAMVNYPRGDLKIKNTYAGPSKNASALPVFIRCFVTEKNNVYVLIFGVPLPDGEKIERLSDVKFKGQLPLSETKEDKDGTYAQYVEYVDETYEVNKPHAEIKVDTYRIWKDANGNEIDKELLRNDHYPEVAGLTVTGTKERPVATPSPAPEGTTTP
jgi:vancomycin resistance protein YoaR